MIAIASGPLPTLMARPAAGRPAFRGLAPLYGRYQPGDQVSYYVTGVGARVKVNEAAKLAVSWDEAAPDENTAYYLAKLDDLYDKFRPLIEQDGLRPAGETEAPTEPSQATLEF